MSLDTSLLSENEILLGDPDYLNYKDSTISELDINEIFEEINRLSDNRDDRPLDEILQEAQTLIEKQQNVFEKHQEQDKPIPFFSLSSESTPLEMRALGLIDQLEVAEEKPLETFPEEVKNYFIYLTFSLKKKISKNIMLNLSSSSQFKC